MRASCMAAVRMIYRNDGCNGKTALGVISELLVHYDVDAFFGMPCIIAAIDGGKLISYWNMSWFSYYAPDGEIGDKDDKETFQTMIRVMSNNDIMAASLSIFFNHHKWTTAGLVYTSTTECQHMAATAQQVFDSCNVQITAEYSTEFSTVEIVVDGPTMTEWLTEIKTEARVVVLCGEFSFIRQFILTAHRMGMTNGDYVYITLNQIPPDNLKTFWSNNDSSDAEARIAFASVYQLAVRMEDNEERETEFLDLIPLKMADPPWNYSGTIDKGLTGSKYALLLYDAVYLYMALTEKLFTTGRCDYRNYTNYQELGRYWRFEGMTGSVIFDYNTDRIMDYNIWYLPTNKDTYELHMIIPMTEAAYNVSECTQWLSPVILSDVVLPSDKPICGFFDELCPHNQSPPEYLWSVISAVLLVLVVGVGVGCYFYRRKTFQEEVAMAKWKVKYKDIKINSRQSVASLLKADISSSGRCYSLITNNHSETSTHNYLIGSYDQQTVAIKFLRCETLTPSSEDLLELKIMRDVNNENLNAFVGLCSEPGRVCILTSYCSRGSLKDILADELIKLDSNFKISFIGDIIKGMDYLHRSPLKYHGRLKTSNALIDSRWTVKITDWGLNRFRTTLSDTENANDYFATLYVAPEILRKCHLSNYSLQKADVYSFAIVVQEILVRAGPFPLEGGVEITFEDTIKRVIIGEIPPLRPFLPATRTFDAKLIEMIRECWSEDPGLRPSFSTIKNRYFGAYKGRLNIMDNMLKLMEKYAGSLEEQVQERTQQLEDEKKKTDMLLYSMLPQNVVDKLKSGSSVHPETFPEVSIYFSDIVFFTTLAAESTPMQVVSLLNDLYTTFDEVISMYDVYKVETIGDAYMVASGVPVANPRHASEIASMSLSIRERVRSFKIRHRPNQPLEIRVGINSGPVVAGIVGLKMPRYCLFGDTVNTASRMESTGQAMRIQLSETAFVALQGSGCSFKTTERGQIEVKGKGMQKTYWLEG